MVKNYLIISFFYVTLCIASDEGKYGPPVEKKDLFLGATFLVPYKIDFSDNFLGLRILYKNKFTERNVSLYISSDYFYKLNTEINRIDLTPRLNFLIYNINKDYFNVALGPIFNINFERQDMFLFSIQGSILFEYLRKIMRSLNFIFTIEDKISYTRKNIFIFAFGFEMSL